MTHDLFYLVCHHQPKRPWEVLWPNAINTVQFVDHVDNHFQENINPMQSPHLELENLNKIHQPHFLVDNIDKVLGPIQMQRVKRKMVDLVIKYPTYVIEFSNKS